MIGVDKRLLTNTVTIRKSTGEKDGWGKVTYDSPVTLSPVRFDRQVAVQGAANNRSQSKSGVLFVYPKYCPITLDDTYLNAVVNDGIRNYRITGITLVTYPHVNKIFCYEIEVI
ncbi:putative minor capsid protein [Streptococcus sp. H49]|uniref:putative minor capsid protein n=1 Tax=Streptococcus huangxiaojuni TaxID=3237239 RepID=UPI0034A15E59